jgi:putative ABC transport system permease protein
MTRSEDDFKAEIEAHIALETDQLMADGLVARDARDLAIKRFGGVVVAQERFYESRRLMWLDHLRRDARYAVRSFLRSPVFTVTAVLSLAIGIGADTAVFTVANGLLLRSPAGVVDPDRLVDISASTADGEYDIEQMSFPDFVDLRERATAFEDIYGYEAVATAMSLARSGGAERIYGHRVTTNFFQVLGVGAAAGRVFNPALTPSDSGTVVLSHRFWLRQFDGDPSIIGQRITVNGQPRDVIGVAAREFRGTSLIATDVWVPIDETPSAGSPLLQRYAGWALARGRIKPGVSVAQAASEVEAIGHMLESDYPREKNGSRFRAAAAILIPGNLSVPVAGVLLLVFGFVSLVLVIAGANLAGVLLARAHARCREMAMRVALGAGRARLIRQLLTETMLLFVMGGTAGVLVARVLTSLIALYLPAVPVPIDISLSLDGRVMAFTTGLSLIAALACGVVPAWHASTPNVIGVLKHDGAVSVSGRGHWRNAFVVAQIAFSIVLIAGASVFIRALQKATSIERGFDLSNVEAATVDLGLANYTQETGPRFIRDLVQRLRALPGVEQATAAAALPTSDATRLALTHPGTMPRAGGSFLDFTANAVEPGYFATLGIPVREGRDFDHGDIEGAPLVAIVSEEAARRFWPGESAVGKALVRHPPFRVLGGPEVPPTTLRIIGVVGDTRARQQASRPQIYLSMQQHYVPALHVLARSSNRRRLSNEIRALVSSRDPNVPILTAQTLEEAAVLSLLPQRLAAGISTALGSVGLLLAALGIYGVTALVVVTRTPEIGVRIAVGAARKDVIWMVLRQGMMLVATGVPIGLVLAGASVQVLTRVLVGIPPIDPIGFALTAVLFVVVGLLACYVPARHASRLQPVVALKCE